MKASTEEKYLCIRCGGQICMEGDIVGGQFRFKEWVHVLKNCWDYDFGNSPDVRPVPEGCLFVHDERMGRSRGVEWDEKSRVKNCEGHQYSN